MSPRQYLLRCLRNMLVVCVPIATCCAWFFSTMLREPFHITLIYSLCIGWSIQALIDIARYVLTAHLGIRAQDSFNAMHYWPGWRWMTPVIFISGWAGYFAGHAVGGLLTGAHRMPSVMIHDMRSFALSMAVASVISFGCVYFFYARARMAVMEAHAQAAMRAAAENQLKMLESQLEPHMLFNTLANLRVLIGMDPPRAQQMLDRMIAFLRATLDASRTGSHPLSAEFDRIRDYLDMMQVRMGTRLRFVLTLPSELAALPVPPLLMQPLVENAIKHGLEPKVQGGSIEVAAERSGDALKLSVRDSGVGMNSLASSGTRFGMQQVRERIGTLYGNTAVLELVPVSGEDGGTLATICLPLSQLTNASTPP
jgi:signal transduction histidine kinase